MSSNDVRAKDDVSNAQLVQLVELDAEPSPPSESPARGARACRVAAFTDALVESGCVDAAVVVASVAACEERCWFAAERAARGPQRSIERYVSPCDLPWFRR